MVQWQHGGLQNRKPKFNSSSTRVPYKDRSSPAAVASQRAARRRHYERNAEEYKTRAVALREELKALVRELKSNPCTDCGQCYPFYVMHFDHLGDKLNNISELVHLGNRQRLLDEIDKCELVCANCHAIRTYQRLGIEARE